MYSASMVKIAMLFCFFEDHLTNLSPKNSALPEVVAGYPCALCKGYLVQLLSSFEVISTLAHIDPETISQTDRARSSRVPIPLPDDPYMAVRRAYLATITDLESEPFNDFRETEIPHPLLIAPLLVPPSDDPCLIVGQNHTPVTIYTKSEPEEAPSETKEIKASEPSDTRSPHHTLQLHQTPPHHYPLIIHLLRPQTCSPPTRVTYYRTAARMAVRTQLTLSPSMSVRIAETTALSPSSFRKRYRFSCETPSPSSSPTFPLRKRYRSTSELVRVTQRMKRVWIQISEGEGFFIRRGSLVQRGKERILSDQLVADETPTLRIPARTTWIDPEDGTVYLDIKVDPRSCAPVQTPPSPDWSPRSLLVSPSSPVVPTTVASPVTTPAATIAVDEDEFLEHTAMQRELQELRDRVTTLEQERSHGGQLIALEWHLRRNTRDLGSFGEETDKTTDLHQHCSRISPQKLETASQITRDAVTNPTTTASQDITTVEIDHAAGGKLRNKNADESWEIIENLALYDHKVWDDTKEFVKLVKVIATPQGIPKTPDQRLFKLEDQINFLLKGSNSSTISIRNYFQGSRTHNQQNPEKVLIREEAKFPVTKNVNSIFIAREEEERSDKTDVTPDNTEIPTETKVPVKEAEMNNEAENEPIKMAEKEEMT
ncbi:hypothetical protein Tco_0729664 [Tanacetum coccineum]|uniref:Uncharacterized protein n=1 Tax=Tanacetum coccineum TaxID=301880 RepID=A0ABQ4YPM1_9ASTR